MPSRYFEKAIRQAVQPGPERLLPGIVLAAASIKEDVDDYLAYYGTLQIDSSPAVSADNVMWVASCAKLATTIAELQCVERGLFALDSTADVERLLPEWAKLEVLSFSEGGSPILIPAKEKITVRRLLTHTSGLAYDFMPPLLQWRQSRGEAWQSMRSPIAECFVHPLIFEPGSAFAYGPGLDVAGLMIARANKCSLESYMRRNIFNTLGMQDSSFDVSHNSIRERLMSMSVRPSPDAPLMDSDPSNVILKPPVDAKDDYGGAVIFSTAVDFLKLLKSILRDDGKILTSQSVDMMFTSSLSAPSKASLEANCSVPELAQLFTPGETVVCEWDHSFGGLLGLHTSDDGFQSPWLQWVGGPNLKRWIDRNGGTCGFYATQLIPPGEPKSVHLQKMFQKAMVDRFRV